MLPVETWRPSRDGQIKSACPGFPGFGEQLATSVRAATKAWGARRHHDWHMDRLRYAGMVPVGMPLPQPPSRSSAQSAAEVPTPFDDPGRPTAGARPPLRGGGLRSP